MRTTAEKQNRSLARASSNRARANTAAPGLDHRQHPIQLLPTAGGTRAESVETGSTVPSSPHFGHDLSHIPIHPPAAGAIQTKLAISEPGDEYEQEADRVAEQVMRMPEPQIQRKCTCGGACPMCQEEQSEEEHVSLQTKHVGSGDLAQTAMPPIVDEVLRSPGQPLDPATRTFFEARFGYDFSHVRVHLGAAAQVSAASERALAYTAGRDLVFGAGEFQPQTMAGRWLIGHELAHVIQQRGSVSGSGATEGTLEREAGDAAMRVALGGSAQISPACGGPGVQFLRVSSGGFGKALEEFTNEWGVEDRAINLLKASTTFAGLVSILDQHYVWIDDPILPRGGEPEMTPDGRLVEPPSVKGKRVLFVTLVGAPAPTFLQFGAPENPTHADRITLDHHDTPGFIRGIAHEATHAAHFVGSPTPRPQTLVDEIEGRIQEEIATRRSEAKILGEIPDPKVKAKISEVGSRVPREVERDLTPLNLTYLEAYFFERELRDQQKSEGLSDEQAESIRDEVDKSTILPKQALFVSRNSKIVPNYAMRWYFRQTAVREWTEFVKSHSPQDPTFAREKEKLLQDHAKRFFEGKVSYRP